MNVLMFGSYPILSPLGAFLMSWRFSSGSPYGQLPYLFSLFLIGCSNGKLVKLSAYDWGVSTVYLQGLLVDVLSSHTCSAATCVNSTFLVRFLSHGHV
jgi:hypothetical protein